MLCCCAFGYAQNLTLAANLPYPFALANIGGYVDSHGTEYALVGTEEGLSIVDVSTPTNPVEIFAVPGLTSEWREVKTWSHYAYVTTEAGDGLQIINLDYIPDSIQVKQYHGDGAIAGQLDNIHALHIDNGFVYLFGGSVFNGAAKICDLNSDPWNPHYLGRTPGPYVHDGFVRNDTLWAGHIYDGFFRVYNCANKANPILLAEQTTPGEFTHNTWLSADSHTLFTTDEVDDSYLTSYDVSDLSNIHELDRFQTTPGSQSIVHNTHILQVNGGEFAVTSWYKDGVVITDVTRPDNIVQIARYDTYPQGSGGNYAGDWGVYPFLPSHVIVASDINNGLYVLTPNYVRACYLEGNVTDSISGVPLNNVSIQVIATSLTANSAITGDYKTGTSDAGTYDVQFSKAGYVTRTITGVVLTNGVVTTLNVKLYPTSLLSLTGQVVETVTGTPIANATVNVHNSTFDFNVTTNATGNFSISNFTPDTYDITAGIWGHRINCTTGVNVNGTTPITITLDKGYYDEFTLDYGWNVAGASSNEWVRDIPVGTNQMGTQANPSVDAGVDCGNYCFVTDNGGGGAWDNDVDGGNTVLTSPVFDATLYTSPQVNYYRWFSNFGDNGGGTADDTMTVKLTNGITTATLETILNTAANNATWVSKSYKISDYLTPTANMRFIVETADWGPTFNIVEGGLDKFEVVESPLAVNEISVAGLSLSAYPNPFNNAVSIKISGIATVTNMELLITDIEGKFIDSKKVSASQSNLEIGSEFPAGVYFLQLKSAEKISGVLKVVKLN